MLARVSTTLDRVLQAIVIFLVVALTMVVVVAVIYRKAGASLVWYDEVASIMLAWLTYYGAAYAALKRGHIGFDGLVRAMPPATRAIFVVISEICVFAFFIMLAWTGWVVMEALEGDTLISLTFVPVQFTQSVMPIGAVLFVICEAVSLPGYWRRLGEERFDKHAPPAGGDGGAVR